MKLARLFVAQIQQLATEIFEHEFCVVIISTECSEEERKLIGVHSRSCCFGILLTVALAPQPGWGNNQSAAENKTVAVSEKKVDPSIIQGDRLMSALDPEHAIECYKQAVANEPKRAVPHFKLAEAFAQSEEFDQAIEQYKLGLQIAPASAVAMKGLVHVCIAAGKFTEGIKIMDSIIQQHPLYYGNYSQRSQLYVLAGDPHKAVEDANKAVSLNPTAMTVGIRGDAYMADKQYAKAAADFTTALAKSKNQPNYFKSRAQAYQKMGRADLAKKDLQSVSNYSRDLYNDSPFWTRNMK